MSWPVDLALEMYETYWNTQPDQPELGEQVFLHAASAWDTNVMTTCSRKMFNTLKTPVWGRVAAWSEWVSVRYITDVKPRPHR